MKKPFLLRHSPKWDEAMFIVGNILVIGLCLGGALYLLAPELFQKLMWPCVFHEMTGFYCPGCGGTRAFRAMLSGDFRKSLWYHPFILYGSVVGGVYYFRYLLAIVLSKWSRGRITPRKPYFYYWYIAVALALYAGNFIWKNGVLLIRGIPLL